MTAKDHTNHHVTSGGVKESVCVLSSLIDESSIALEKSDRRARASFSTQHGHFEGLRLRHVAIASLDLH